VDENTTAKKPGPLYIIQYYQFYQPNFMVGNVTEGKGCFFRYAGFIYSTVYCNFDIRKLQKIVKIVLEQSSITRAIKILYVYVHM
jgi:hypothetical protein